MTVLVHNFPFLPSCDADFDLLCRCGHSYGDHTFSETEEGSDCEHATCLCTCFRLKA
jgi:hypothetical protein